MYLVVTKDRQTLSLRINKHTLYVYIAMIPFKFYATLTIEGD